MTEQLALRHWQDRAERAEDRLHMLEAALRKADEAAKRGKNGVDGVHPAQHFNTIRNITRAALYNHRSGYP